MSEALYNERLARVNDALELRAPDRVPIAPMYMTFPFLFSGYTMAEVNYDVGKAKDALRKYANHFQPDMIYDYAPIFAGQFPMWEKVAPNWLQWASPSKSKQSRRRLLTS
jgi:hypothetical protein